MYINDLQVSACRVILIMLKLVQCTTLWAVNTGAQGAWPLRCTKNDHLAPLPPYALEGGSRSKFFRNPLEDIT